MKYRKEGNKIYITLLADFNYRAVTEIKKNLDEENQIEIELRKAKFVDTEAIIFIHKLMSNGKQIRLRKTPKILSECLRALDLEKIWLSSIDIEFKE